MGDRMRIARALSYLTECPARRVALRRWRAIGRSTSEIDLLDDHRLAKHGRIKWQRSRQ
jgi:hypothetical protein